MTEQEFKALQGTFPWTKRVAMTNGVGGIVQVINKNGAEVPLFVMTDFLEMITRKLQQKETTSETAGT